MIPKIIHYCWIGGAPLPESAERCIVTWHKYMPEWEYMRWDESNFDIAAAPLYVRQAYEARKFAFVSDYVRLWALEQYGGLYMDVDFEVYRPFDDLLERYSAFAGYEGSKRIPVMQGVLASEPHGTWVKDMLFTYNSRPFIKPDGSLDLTPNTSYFTDRLESQGFIADGVEKDFFMEKSPISNLQSPISNCTWNIHATCFPSALFLSCSYNRRRCPNYRNLLRAQRRKFLGCEQLMESKSNMHVKSSVENKNY